MKGYDVLHVVDGLTCWVKEPGRWMFTTIDLVTTSYRHRATDQFDNQIEFPFHADVTISRDLFETWVRLGCPRPKDLGLTGGYFHDNWTHVVQATLDGLGIKPSLDNLDLLKVSLKLRGEA